MNELERYRQLKRDIKLYKDEVKELKTLGTAAEAEERKLNELIENAIAERTKITERINRVDDLLYRELLIRRFIACQTYEQIAESMSMSTRWVYKLMKRAFKYLEK